MVFLYILFAVLAVFTLKLLGRLTGVERRLAAMESTLLTLQDATPDASQQDEASAEDTQSSGTRAKSWNQQPDIADEIRMLPSAQPDVAETTTAEPSPIATEPVLEDEPAVQAAPLLNETDEVTEHPVETNDLQADAADTTDAGTNTDRGVEPSAPVTTAPTWMNPAVADGGTQGQDSRAKQTGAEQTGVAAVASGTTRDRLEQMVGGNWTVWIGGLALALGGIFLVRYSIEQGYFGPGVRLTLAGLFGIALLVLGEWTRRQETRSPISQINSAYIPGILTAAGSAVLFANAYGAHALYGLVGPATSFFLLAIVSLMTLSAALIHGPWLAGLGLVGSYVTPLLVTSQTPNAWALFTFLLVVTASAHLLARIRKWEWLVTAAATGALGWGALYLANVGAPDTLAVGTYIAIVTAIFLFTPTRTKPDSSFDNEERRDAHAPDRPALAALIAAVFLGLVLVQKDAHSVTSLWSLVAVVALILIGAWRRPALTFAVPAAGFAVFAAYFTWGLASLAINASLSDLTREGVAFDPNPWFIPAGFAAGIVFLTLGFLGARRGFPQDKTSAFVWAVSGVTLPPMILVAAYGRVLYADSQTGYWLVAFALALVMAAITRFFMAQDGEDTQKSIIASPFAAGGIGSTALGLAMALSGGWLTLSYAVLAGLLSVIHARQPLKIIRFLAAAIATFTTARVIEFPLVFSFDIGTTPIFNWLLPAYGVPTICFAIAAWQFGRRQSDWVCKLFEGLTVLFVTLLVGIQIRHFMNDGVVLTTDLTLAEQSLQTLSALALSGTLMRLNDRSPSPVFAIGSMIIGYGSMAMIALSHFFYLNPMVTGEPVGTNKVFNLLLLAYALPGIAAFGVHWIARTRRPEHYVFATGAVGLLLLFAYVTLTVRHLFEGSVLGTIAPPDQSLLWAFTYAPVYLTVFCGLVALRRFFSPTIIALGLPAIGVYIALHFVYVNLGLRLPLFSGDNVGDGWVWNLLLPGYAITAIGFLAVAWLTRKDFPSWISPSGLALSAIAGFTYVTLMVRHAYEGGNIQLAGLHDVSLAEGYTYVPVWSSILCLVLMFSARLPKDVRVNALPIAGGCLLAALLVIHFGYFFPMFSYEDVGNGHFLNLLVPGYLIPTALLAAVRHLWPNPEQKIVLNTLFAATIAVGFVYVSLMIRHVFHGGVLLAGTTSSAETYTYSAAWLICGVVILLLGALRRDQNLRLASAAIIFVTVFKVFLLDMSELEGVLRALSFIGLGVVLIGTGLLYQRLLFQPRNPAHE